MADVKPLGRRAIAVRIDEITTLAEGDANVMMADQRALSARVLEGCAWLDKRRHWLGEADELLRLLGAFVDAIADESIVPHPNIIADAEALIARCRRLQRK